MPATRISELPSSVSATGAVLLGVQAGETRRVPVSLIIPSADPAAGTPGSRTLDGGAGSAASRDTIADGSLAGGVAIRPRLDDWYAKLRAASLAAPVDVLWIGDSIATKGTIAEPAHSWQTINALNELVGSPAPPTAVFAQSFGTADAPVATGAGGTGAEIGLGGHSASLTNGQTLSHTAVAKAFRVTFVDTGTGTLTFRDGPGGTVLGTRVNTNTGKLLVWNQPTPFAGAAVSHTLHITSTGNTNVGQIIPLNDTRVIGHYAVHSGYASASYTADPAKALDLVEWLDANGNLGLVIIATGTNDEANYSTWMPALRAAIEARTDADVALWVPYPSAAVLPAEYATTHPAALASGLPLIDSGTYFARFAPTWTVDTIHPTPAGHKLLAAHDVTVLSGDPIGQLARRQALAPVIGTAATDAAPGNVLLTARDHIHFDDDFNEGDNTLSGSIGAKRWTRTGGTSANVTTFMDGHHGAVRLVPAAGANNSVLSHSFAVPDLAASPHQYDYAFWWRTSGNLANHSQQVGIGQHLNGLYFERPTGAAFWDIVNVYLGTEVNRVTSTIPVSGSWLFGRIQSFGTGAVMSLNGTVITVVAAPVLFGGPFARAAQTTGSGSYVDLDRVSLTIWNLTRQA